MSKPAIKREKVEALLKKHGVDLSKEQCVLVGVRGYYRDSMGKKGKNDIGIWDDGFVWLDQTNMATFNGNTDPSRYYSRVATLATGKWRYKKGPHGISRGNPYPAFRQAANVTVLRYKDGVSFDQATGDFAINIHRGGANTTSSAGCQTLPPAQWPAFKEYGYMLLDKHKKKDFLYLLVENDGSIA